MLQVYDDVIYFTVFCISNLLGYVFLFKKKGKSSSSRKPFRTRKLVRLQLSNLLRACQ